MFYKTIHMYYLKKSHNLLKKKKSRDNYSKPYWGLARLHFAYPWFKTYHCAHSKLVLLAFHNPPLRLPLEIHIFRLKQIKQE